MKINFALLKDFATPENFFKPSLEINLELLKVLGVIFGAIFIFGWLLFFIKKYFGEPELKKEYYKKFYWAFWTFAIFGIVWSLLGYQKVPFLSSGIALILIFVLFIYKLLKAFWLILKVYPKEHEKKKEFERKLKYLKR